MIAVRRLVHALIALISVTVAATAPAETFEGEIELFEFDLDGDDQVLLDSSFSYGSETDRIVARLEAGGTVGNRLDEIEGQLLYSRSIGGDFVLLAGVRHEFRPHPHLSYGVLGVEGEPAEGLTFEALMFLSERGDGSGEVEAVYDYELAPRVVLQPRVTLSFSFQETPDQGLGTGFTDAELGLRLRYELTDYFASYIGVSHERLLGDTREIGRANGDILSATHALIGFSASF